MMNYSRKQLLKIRRNIHLAAVSLPDDVAVETPEIFPAWQPDFDYKNGDRVRDEDKLYKLIPETHHSQEDWPPHLVPAVWARIDDPSEEWPEWVQPLGPQDSYADGAKVSHNGKHWINVHGDGNVWEPGIYGWEEV